MSKTKSSGSFFCRTSARYVSKLRHGVASKKPKLSLPSSPAASLQSSSLQGSR
ncbi:hypothetical protein [Lutibaculum baratangense]|uniref:hypothetical protein n=1 Tax=Lutibaculum baratangense TaxID=1358440 RepID=UPI00136453E9|nr:hypothetical protein [Lutibaculum baratangense]